jgi:hypothetical protein
MNTATINLKKCCLSEREDTVLTIVNKLYTARVYTYTMRVDYSRRFVSQENEVCKLYAFSVYYTLNVDINIRLERVDELGMFVLDDDNKIVNLEDCLELPGFVASFDDYLHYVE